MHKNNDYLVRCLVLLKTANCFGAETSSLFHPSDPAKGGDNENCVLCLWPCTGTL